jgi:beta-glucosidase-like glycosyl hydrolase
MDQTMSGGFSAATTAAILGGAVPQARVDDALTRILTALFSVGVFVSLRCACKRLGVHGEY